MTSLALCTKENKGKANKDPFLLVFEMFLLSAHNSGLHTFPAKGSRVDNIDFRLHDLCAAAQYCESNPETLCEQTCTSVLSHNFVCTEIQLKYNVYVLQNGILFSPNV